MPSSGCDSDGLVLERAQLLDIVPLRVSHSPDLAEEVGTAPLG